MGQPPLCKFLYSFLSFTHLLTATLASSAYALATHHASHSLAYAHTHTHPPRTSPNTRPVCVLHTLRWRSPLALCSSAPVTPTRPPPTHQRRDVANTHSPRMGTLPAHCGIEGELSFYPFSCAPVDPRQTPAHAAVPGRVPTTKCHTHHPCTAKSHTAQGPHLRASPALATCPHSHPAPCTPPGLPHTSIPHLCQPLCTPPSCGPTHTAHTLGSLPCSHS